MLLSAFSVLVVAQSSSEVPEGLMNNPVFIDVLDSSQGSISSDYPECFFHGFPSSFNVNAKAVT